MNNNNYDANGYPVYPRAGRVLDYEDNKMYNKFVGPDTFAPTSDAIYRLPMSTPHLDKHAAVHEAASLGRFAQNNRKYPDPNANRHTDGGPKVPFGLPQPARIGDWSQKAKRAPEPTGVQFVTPCRPKDSNTIHWSHLDRRFPNHFYDERNPPPPNVCEQKSTLTPEIGFTSTSVYSPSLSSAASSIPDTPIYASASSSSSSSSGPSTPTKNFKKEITFSSSPSTGAESTPRKSRRLAIKRGEKVPDESD